jgi:ubiquinone/menaquinone biosynthesis C-methylase UbiE
MSARAELPAYSMNRTDFPWLYERRLVEPLFRPWAETLLDRAELAPESSVLDVACGTGIVARLARRRAGAAARVVGIDVSGPMLEVARAIEPSVDWRQGDAAALPVAADERFDWVLCQQGLQFFGDRAAAARELRRVLGARGTLLATVWRAAEEVPLFDALQRVAERHVGPIHDQRYAFGDAAAFASLLRDAGFATVEVDTLSLEHRFPAETEFVRMNAMALVGMSGARLGEAERERVLEAIVEESADAARELTDDGALVCEMRTNLAVARA